MPGGRVFSIEGSLQAARKRSPGFASAMPHDEHQADRDWETYVLLEGTRLRIQQANQEDLFLNIPVRTPQVRELVFRDHLP